MLFRVSRVRLQLTNMNKGVKLNELQKSASRTFCHSIVVQLALIDLRDCTKQYYFYVSPYDKASYRD